MLALLREGLSNEQIAQRLDITERTAKYHVSEILSKLSVRSREDAARWQPEARPWWAAAAAPLLLWRKLGFGWLAGAAAGMAVVGVAAGVGVVMWGLVRTDGSSSASFPTERVAAPEQLVWEDDYRNMHIESLQPADCGDAETAERNGVPMMLELQETAMGPPEERAFLGLEGIVYDYVPERVNVQQFTLAPEGWELSARQSTEFGPLLNRFSTQELFLRRLDLPDLLFRYERGFCNQDDGSVAYPATAWRPGRIDLVPDEPPEVTESDGTGGPSLEDALDEISNHVGPNMELLRAEQRPNGDWVFQFAGDGMGPAPPGHVYGFEISAIASDLSRTESSCCIDFVVAPLAAAPDSTAQPNVYRDAELGIEFKYPESWG